MNAWTLDPTPATSEVGPGVFYGLLVFFLIGVTVLLWFSLRKQLRRVNFEERTEAPADSPSDSPSDSLGRSQGRPPAT